MEEQLEMKTRRQKEALAENKNRKQTRHFSLQFGSMIAQWIVLFVCLIFIGLCYHRSSDSQTQWIYVKYSYYLTTNKKNVGFKWKAGTMKMEGGHNDTIPIHCDGHYLFFLKGNIILKKANDSLTLRVNLRGKPTFILEVTCRDKETNLQEVVMSELRSNDKVYMEVDHDRIIRNDLMLGLIMLTPHSFCSPEN